MLRQPFSRLTVQAVRRPAVCIRSRMRIGSHQLPYLVAVALQPRPLLLGVPLQVPRRGPDARLQAEIPYVDVPHGSPTAPGLVQVPPGGMRGAVAASVLDRERFVALPSAAFHAPGRAEPWASSPHCAVGVIQ